MANGTTTSIRVKRSKSVVYFGADPNFAEFGLRVVAAKLTDERENFLELGLEVGVVREQLRDLLAEGGDFVFW